MKKTVRRLKISNRRRKTVKRNNKKNKTLSKLLRLSPLSGHKVPTKEFSRSPTTSSLSGQSPPMWFAKGEQPARSKPTSNNTKSHMVKVFFELLNMVKLYHWKTYSYAQHKATDELHERLSENIDKFIEVLLGKDSSRIKMLERRIDLLDPTDATDFKGRIYEHREFLVNMDEIFDKKRDTDLLSIRDDILGDVNQFLYLMTFNK